MLIRETLVYPPRIYPVYPVSDSYLTYILGSSENVVVMALTQKQSRFGFEYCKDYNGTRAAIRAGYSEDGAHTTASRLLQIVEVQERIKDREEELACVAEIDQAWVLRQWRDIALADPRELTRLMVRPCPLCWPEGLKLEEPNPLCSDPIMSAEGFNLGGCGGSGRPAVALGDTSKLSRRGRMLFAGVKETKNGIEIKMRDQDAALANISNYMGMNVRKTELSGPGGAPMQVLTADLSSLSDAELEAIIRANTLPKGTIEGTLPLSDGNTPAIKELEPGSTP